MSAAAPHHVADAESMFPLRYRSLRVLMALTILGSVISSAWLMPSLVERVAVAVEQGDQPLLDHELDLAAHRPVDPGEARALVDVALTLGAPETAAAILERFLAARPGSVEGLRLLIEVQRQRHLTREVAALDERLYALTADPDALRDAADIYASRHMGVERIDALRRLAAIGRATDSDIGELTHRLADGGDRAGALALLMRWLSAPPTSPVPAELLGLAAGLSAGAPDGPAIAAQLGGLIARGGEVGPLHVLIQTYAERGHAELSLIAGRALGDPMSARPQVAVALAQLEALRGEFAAAYARLDALDRAGTPPPDGLVLLADLSLQAGQLERATTAAAGLSSEQMPEGLPHRLVEALDSAGRTDLLARLPLDQIASSSPASAASIALARGDRARATAMTLAAFGPGADPADLGPALGRVIRTLGLEHEAIDRLVQMSRAGALDEEALSLVLDLAATTHAEIPALLDALLAQRDLSPRAGNVWAMLAAHNGRATAVATWLRSSGSRLAAQTLIDLLLLAAERNEAALARATADMLTGRADLPTGWTEGEIALLTHARETLTATRLQNALDLIGSAKTDNAARDRIAANLVGTPGFAQVATTFRLAETHPAVAWLAGAAAAGGSAERTLARLELLAALAPQRALGLLAERVAADPHRLWPILVAARLRAGQAAEAESALRSVLRDLPPKQQDATLYETLARLPPGAILPVLRVAAGTGRSEWKTAYEERLARAGMLDELRAALRAEAATGHDPKRLQSLASRLVELNDRPDAVAILTTLAAGKPPASPEVEQLMFLWGPRAAPDALAWTRDRALAAPLDALPKWLEHLAYLGDPGGVISIVARRPAALSGSVGAVRAYDAALIATHSTARPDLRGAIAAASAPDLLTALAQLAIDTAQSASAWEAARAAVRGAPNDPAALLLGAQAAAAIHRSEDAAVLYERLLALGPQPIDVSVDAGDALIMAKRTAEGRKILDAVLTRLPVTPTTLAAARLRARTLMLLARDDEAAVLLTEWFGRFPSHAGLRADLLQAHLDEQQTAH